MCSRTRENNKNKVGPVIWDTLYVIYWLMMICQGEKFIKPEEVLEPKVHFSVTFNKEKMEKSSSSSENNAGNFLK